MNRAIFLDRDGVLNRTIFRNGKPRAPYTLEEFSLITGVEEAIEKLRREGFKLIVVTNQPDVARGWVSRGAVDLVNQKLFELLPLDDIEVCFHTDEDRCDCRKPQPGMLLTAAEKWNVNLPESYMIGDRNSDVLAGKRAGCKTVLVGENESDEEGSDHQASTLLTALSFILPTS